MHLRVKELMKELVEAPAGSMPSTVAELAKRRWMAGNDEGPIIQLELLDDGKRGIMFAIMARDGSGPLRASFMTMLMLEDTFAVVQEPFGVCSGEATVAIYRYVDLACFDRDRLRSSLAGFAQLADVVLGDYLSKPTALSAPPAHSAA